MMPSTPPADALAVRVVRRVVALRDSPHPGALPFERSLLLECDHDRPWSMGLPVPIECRCGICSAAEARRLDATEARP